MQRDISIFGRILLTKVEPLSRCIYPVGSLPISNKKIKLIDQMNFNYIWKRKAHYVKKRDTSERLQRRGFTGHRL